MRATRFGEDHTMKATTEPAYADAGFEVLQGALNPGHAAALDTALRTLYFAEEEPPTPSQDEPVLQVWRHRSDGHSSFIAIDTLPEMRALLDDDALLHRFADVIGANRLQLFEAIAIIKPPQSPDGFAWHSDASFFPFDKDSFATLYIGVTPCNAETGGMRMAIGSHKTGPWASINVKTGERMTASSTLPLPPSDPAGAGLPVVQTDLSAGDAVAFHGHTLHQSDGNTSEDTLRTGLVLRFVVRDTKVEVTEETRAKFVDSIRRDSDGRLVESARLPVLWRRA